MLEALDLPYRVVQMCTGDLSFTAANEVRPRSLGARIATSGWRSRPARTSAISRRGGPTSASGRKREAKPQFVHTLNGSGLALPRTMIAIMENYQNPDGSFDMPDVLLPYMDGVTRISGA